MRTKLLVLQGLPGSGKTTFARQCAQMGVPHIVRVNKDDIREELTKQGWVWSQENEKDVIKVRDTQIETGFRDGATVVISDDTNFGKHPEALRKLAQRLGVEFELKRFDIPPEECIRRDAGRAKSVGEAVIWGMWEKYLKPKGVTPVPPIERVPGAPSAIICDLDGTLAINNGHRSHYDASTADEDDLCEAIWDIIAVFDMTRLANVLYVSGRFEKDREPTQRFLNQHNCPNGPLWMRADGDYRNDAIVKRELFDRHIRGNYNVEFCLDDRTRVVKMWRSLGLKCLQVAEGDF